MRYRGVVHVKSLREQRVDITETVLNRKVQLEFTKRVFDPVTCTG